MGNLKYASNATDCNTRSVALLSFKVLRFLRREISRFAYLLVCSDHTKEVSQTERMFSQRPLGMLTFIYKKTVKKLKGEYLKWQNS